MIQSASYRWQLKYRVYRYTDADISESHDYFFVGLVFWLAVIDSFYLIAFGSNAFYALLFNTSIQTKSQLVCFISGVANQFFGSLGALWHIIIALYLLYLLLLSNDYYKLKNSESVHDNTNKKSIFTSHNKHITKYKTASIDTKTKTTTGTTLTTAITTPTTNTHVTTPTTGTTGTTTTSGGKNGKKNKNNRNGRNRRNHKNNTNRTSDKYTEYTNNDKQQQEQFVKKKNARIVRNVGGFNYHMYDITASSERELYTDELFNKCSFQEIFNILKCIMIVIAFIGTIVPIFVNGNHYTVISNYYQKSNNSHKKNDDNSNNDSNRHGYGHECWIEGSFELIDYSFVMVSLLFHFIVLFVTICKYCQTKTFTNAYSYLILRLLPWVVVYTIVRVIPTLDRVWDQIGSEYSVPLWLVVGHDSTIASLGIANAIVWCFNRSIDKNISQNYDHSRKKSKNRKRNTRTTNNNYNNYNSNCNYNSNMNNNDRNKKYCDKNLNNRENSINILETTTDSTSTRSGSTFFTSTREATSTNAAGNNYYYHHQYNPNENGNGNGNAPGGTNILFQNNHNNGINRNRNINGNNRSNINCNNGASSRSLPLPIAHEIGVNPGVGVGIGVGVDYGNNYYVDTNNDVNITVSPSINGSPNRQQLRQQRQQEKQQRRPRQKISSASNNGYHDQTQQRHGQNMQHNFPIVGTTNKSKNKSTNKNRNKNKRKRKKRGIKKGSFDVIASEKSNQNRTDSEQRYMDEMSTAVEDGFVDDLSQ